MGLTAIDMPTTRSYSAYDSSELDNFIQRYDLFKGTGGSVSCIHASITGLRALVSEQGKRGFLSAIDRIKDVFSLTDQELCNVCNISSRRTLYNWRNDDTKKPRTETLKRIFSLLAVSEAWSASGFKYKKEQLHKKIVGGESLFDLLIKNKIDEDLVLFVGSTLTMDSEVQAISDPFV